MRLGALLDLRSHAREAQLAHALRTVPLFRDLPAGDLVALWRRLDEVHVRAGTVLCARGDPGEHCYLVQRGAVEVRLGLGAEGWPLLRVPPGGLVGEMALITGAPRTADVVAVEDSVLWVLDRADFDALTTTSVPLLRALNRLLCDRLAVTTLEVEDLRAQGGAPGGAVAGLRFGPYRVVQQIGSGGMAVVFSAVHVDTEEAAAVKVLPAAWCGAAELRARLAREAAVLQRLAHPNVVRVLDVGEVGAHLGGGCYLAMEWLPHALDRVLRAQFPEPLPPAAALGIVAQVADGLAAVHGAGVIHRDVKPANILLRANGTPVLTDFGLVAFQEGTPGSAEAARLTQTNVVCGTADYMAPEQIVGAPLDGRCDLYALGVVLYELLAGHVPFAGRDPVQTLHAHAEEPPPPLSDAVPAGARAIVARALQKEPAARFASAAEMAQALRAAGALAEDR